MVGFFMGNFFRFLPTLINSEICYPHLISGGIIDFAYYPPYKLGVLDHFLINFLIMLIRVQAGRNSNEK